MDGLPDTDIAFADEPVSGLMAVKINTKQ